MIENDIRIYLLAQAPIAQLLGSDAPGAPARLSPQERQQNGPLPAIVYERTGTEHLQGLEAAIGYATAHLEFDCMSATYAGARQLAECLRGELQGFRGTMGNQKICSVQLQDESDDFDPPADGSTQGVYHVIHSYDFQFTESIPTFT